MEFFDIPYEMGYDGFISSDGEYPSGIPSSYKDIIWNFECDGLWYGEYDWIWWKYHVSEYDGTMNNDGKNHRE